MSKPADHPRSVQADAVNLPWQWVRALRPHQWVKNLLLFAPLVLAHQWQNVEKVTQTLYGFLAFSAIASAIYLINDVADVEADRRHPIKRRRPIAAGHVSAPMALVLAVSLVLVGGIVSLTVIREIWFTVILAGYLVATSFYSLWLKRVALLDVFLLASLYTLRLFAGGVAADVQVSKWLLAFSCFLFSSLAFVKRFAELERVEGEGEKQALGRGYSTGDLGLIEIMGVVSGYLSVLVLALYVNGEDVQRIYSQHRFLWLMCPLLMYWISRVWMLAKRRRLSEDPVVFASTDPVSWVVGAVAAAIVWFAR